MALHAHLIDPMFARSREPGKVHGPSTGRALGAERLEVIDCQRGGGEVEAVRIEALGRKGDDFVVRM
jgi:hypothetical protein